MQYDSILIQSFGGPEGQSDVIPFLQNVTKGRNVPIGRLEVVAEQYRHFGGVSPINQLCRDFQSSLVSELKAAEIDLPVFWGNRNWEPFLGDVVADMAQQGFKNSLVFTTSAFSSYSGCRQYREDLELAASGSPTPMNLKKLRLYYNHPEFIEGWVENIESEKDKISSDAQLVFTAHSVPTAMADASEYVPQLHEAASLITDRLAAFDSYDLVYQSRSGSPRTPWLEPDINDHLKNLADKGIESVVVVPLGFTMDHMEVMYDLDLQASESADSLGLNFVRPSAVGSNSRFTKMAVDLIREQVDNLVPAALGELGPWPDECPAGHCLFR